MTVATPPVDRGCRDAMTDKNDIYRVGVKQGLLQSRFSQNQFEVCQETIVDLCDIDQSRMLSIRQAVSIGSLGG